MQCAFLSLVKPFSLFFSFSEEEKKLLGHIIELLISGDSIQVYARNICQIK